MPSTRHSFESNLDKNSANYAALSPISFLQRSAQIYPNKIAVINGVQRFTYGQFFERARRLASSLTKLGVGKLDTVAVMAPNVPPLLEAHYAVPAIGAVLNAINTRLDPESVAFILNHGEAKVLIVDPDLMPIAKEALKSVERDLIVVDALDHNLPPSEQLGSLTYDELLMDGDPNFDWTLPEDEWASCSLNYTSGTTGNPKGVVYHHRGAYLNALGNLIAFGLNPETVYLWTLPMFHCNGWTFTWAVTAASGTHVCLRRVEPKQIFRLIADEKVSHMCGAPIVLNMIANAPVEQRTEFSKRVRCATGGAPPPSAVIEAMGELGFDVIHLYGLTESYGPATLCAWQEEWNGLGKQDQAVMMSRQGVHYVTLEDAIVANPDTCVPVPQDGTTIGEILLKGHTVMKGYLKNPEASAEAFHGGWYHTGDLAVWYGDRYIEVKDRAKDVIISGGENISSIEVEEVLFRHPKVLEAAVVARPDPKWGEHPCAFVTLHEGEEATAEEIINFCKENMARFKAPGTVVFADLPKTSTGKVQKFTLRDQAKAL
ncbi:MAG: acyl-CoA synthetase [Alphaproteobacteria bacterium]